YITRADGRFPGLVTQVQYPNGRQASADYDDRGNLLATTQWNPYGDGRNATSLYTWDGVFDEMTSSTSGEGVVRYFAYDAAGRRTWEQLGSDSARRVTYGYYPSNHVYAPNLVQTVTAATGTQHLEYDVQGNLSAAQDELGAWTLWDKDALGRDTLLITPVDSAGASTQAGLRASGATHRVWYDALGRDTLNVSTGPSRTDLTRNAGLVTSPAQSAWVRSGFDAAGRTTFVERWSTPDTTHVGHATTRWHYDIFGRRTAEVAPDNAADSSVYDPAGNVVKRVGRLGDAVTMRYDAIGRLLHREVPRVWRANVDPLDMWGAGNSLIPAPYFGPDAVGALEVKSTADPGGVWVPGDTADFAYDESGNMLRAVNGSAWITRTYYPNGALKTDSLTIRPYVGRDSTLHGYLLRYEYDRDGRRTALYHPRNLQPYRAATAPAQTYGYVPGTGELSSVGGLMGEGYSWTYDARGWLASLTRNNVAERYTYDAFGREVRRLEVVGSDTMHDDRIAYDARGKQVLVATRQDTTFNIYSGLGTLSVSERVPRMGSQSSRSVERFVLDGLGNQQLTRQQSSGANELAYTSAPDSMYYQYQVGTARLLHRYGATAMDTSAFDAAGNRRWMFSERLASTPYSWSGCSGSGRFKICSTTTGSSATLYEAVHQYYGADGKLRLLDRRSCLIYTAQGCDTIRVPLPADRSVFEEYRYDALGRRVLVRSRQEHMCRQKCLNVVRRTIWDGDQVLYEINAPGRTGTVASEMERDTGFVVHVATSSFTQPADLDTAAVGSASDTLAQAEYYGGFYYGRVGYVHGPGIDAPLSMMRMEYSDSLPGPQLVYLHNDWRGQFDFGSYEWSSDKLARPCVQITKSSNFQTVTPDGSTAEPKPTFSPLNSSYKHCLDVDWPAPHVYVTRQSRGTSIAGPSGWTGTLVDGMRDASGQMYMRNRYYDPASGRFTQEDPIGLAGGLNAFGFAGGEPIMYSDPFGLDKCQDIRNDIAKRTRSLNRRIRQYLEAVEDGTNDARHLNQNIAQERV
ncbi:MAG TPA: RHS repeat-associated core domain-containing protein, partial [Chloroflexota bacterium]|nr:RHS repeat-associated core domain-containing protein [Chloroflexota bacterium]